MGDGLLGFSIAVMEDLSEEVADVETPGKTWEKSAPNRRNSRCKYSEAE